MQTRIAAVISVAERTGPGAGDGPEPAYNCLLGREAALRSCPRLVRGVCPPRALLRRDSASVGRLVAGDDELAAFPRAGDRARLLAGRPLRRTGATDRNGTNRELPRPRDPDRARVRDRHGS